MGTTLSSTAAALCGTSTEGAGSGWGAAAISTLTGASASTANGLCRLWLRGQLGLPPQQKARQQVLWPQQELAPWPLRPRRAPLPELKLRRAAAPLAALQPAPAALASRLLQAAVPVGPQPPALAATASDCNAGCGSGCFTAIGSDGRGGVSTITALETVELPPSRAATGVAPNVIG